MPENKTQPPTLLPDPLPTPLVRFPVLITLPVLWGNMDALGHVNNTVAIRWFESGRVALLERMGVADLMTGDQLGPILAAVRCNYRRQVHYPDTVVVGTRVASWGRTSVTVEHVIYRLKRQDVTSDGESVVVIFNYQEQRPVRLPESFRQAVLLLQPHEPPLDRPHAAS